MMRGRRGGKGRKARVAELLCCSQKVKEVRNPELGDL